MPHLEEFKKKSLLIRWRTPVYFSSWAFFIAYQVLIGLDRLYSPAPLCPHSDRQFQPWYHYICYGCLGGFLIVWLVLFIKLVRVNNSAKAIPLFVAFNIVSMGTISTFLSVVMHWGGMCIDVFKVSTPASIFGEWIACAPLIIFFAITNISNPFVLKLNWTWITAFIIAVISIYFVAVPQDYGRRLVVLCVTFTAYVPVFFLSLYYTNYNPVALSVPTAANVDRMVSVFSDCYSERYKLSAWLFIVIPLFLINYAFAALNYLDVPQAIAVYNILSIVTKGLFAASTMDIHLTFMLETELEELEKQRADEARRAFMKYIFHEVRTPLSSLTMGIEILSLSANLDSSELQSLQLMKSASEFMSNTLDGVLSIHKIEEGNFSLQLAPFSWVDVIEKVCRVYAGAAKVKNIALRVDISKDVSFQVIGDANRLENVIGNLLSNALKFSPMNSAVDLQILCNSIVRQHDEGNNSWTTTASISVLVKDQGTGISPELQESIFDNFAQTRPGSLQEGKGSGLGLSFCKRIVDFHNGIISVTSEVSKGSAFKITIPFPISQEPVNASMLGQNFSFVIESQKSEQPLLVEKHDRNTTCASSSTPTPALQNAAAITPSSSSIVETAAEASLAPLINSVIPITADQKPIVLGLNSHVTASSHTPLEVLVVDDADSNRKLLVMLLKRKNKQSSSAENGAIAVDMVKADPARRQLILMDNLMPVMNGLQATAEIRKMGYPFLIVGVTGNVLESDIQEFLSAGADLVLAKPLKTSTMNALFEFIEKFGTVSRQDMVIEIGPTGEMAWAAKKAKG